MRTTKVTISCDMCGLVKDNIQAIAIDYSRYTDGAGDSDDRTLYCDLCPSCMKVVIQNAYDYRYPASFEDFKKSLEHYTEG